MIKDFADLSSKTEREIRNLSNMPGSDINTEDVSEITDWAEARRGLFYRNPGKTRFTS